MLHATAVTAKSMADYFNDLLAITISFKRLWRTSDFQ
jgi:hypothetical protein